MLLIDQLSQFQNLSYAEIAVAKLLMTLKSEIKDISIRDLANQAFTSTSAITRLCHKLGFDGYKSFKEKYIEECHYLDQCFGSVDANQPFTKDDNLTRVCASIGELYQETAKDTLSLIDYYDLIDAIRILEKSHYIYVLCIGTSLELGKIFAERMAKIGKTVIVSENLNTQYYQSYNASENECFIMISYTGTTYKTLQFIDNLANSKAKKILLTSIGNEHLKDKIDVILTMTTREKLYSNIATYTSTISTMLLLDLLYSAFFQRNYEENLSHKKQIAKKYEPNRKASQSIMEED